MKDETFVPREYDVFAGLDVDKKSIAATFSSPQGFIRSLHMPYSVDYLLNHVRKHFGDQKVAFVYEAGPTGYGLYDGLVAQGYRCLVAAPSMIPRAPGQRVKTNRLDSRGLSESLRGGQLKSIHVPSPIYRELAILRSCATRWCGRRPLISSGSRRCCCSKASAFPRRLPVGSGR